jgi:uncharacterized MAPEG superfamily protein
VTAFPDGRLKHSFVGAAVGTVMTWGGFALAWPVVPVPALSDQPADRLVYACGLLAVPAALVAVMVMAVALSRLVTGALDPLTDPEHRIQRINQRVLSNTVEQTAIFVPALLALTSRIDMEFTAALPLLTGLFILSRLIFWAGYLIDPLYRATGMIMTLNVNVGILLIALMKLATV